MWSNPLHRKNIALFLELFQPSKGNKLLKIFGINGEIWYGKWEFFIRFYAIAVDQSSGVYLGYK